MIVANVFNDEWGQLDERRSFLCGLEKWPVVNSITLCMKLSDLQLQ